MAAGKQYKNKMRRCGRQKRPKKLCENDRKKVWTDHSSAKQVRVPSDFFGPLLSGQGVAGHMLCSQRCEKERWSDSLNSHWVPRAPAIVLLCWNGMPQKFLFLNILQMNAEHMRLRLLLHVMSSPQRIGSSNVSHEVYNVIFQAPNCSNHSFPRHGRKQDAQWLVATTPTRD